MKCLSPFPRGSWGSAGLSSPSGYFFYSPFSPGSSRAGRLDSPFSTNTLQRSPFSRGLGLFYFYLPLALFSSPFLAGTDSLLPPHAVFFFSNSWSSLSLPLPSGLLLPARLAHILFSLLARVLGLGWLPRGYILQPAGLALFNLLAWLSSTSSSSRGFLQPLPSRAGRFTLSLRAVSSTSWRYARSRAGIFYLSLLARVDLLAWFFSRG